MRLIRAAAIIDAATLSQDKPPVDSAATRAADRYGLLIHDGYRPWATPSYSGT